MPRGRSRDVGDGPDAAGARARDDDLATLCQSCGLCCDGTLFGAVTLEPDEVATARAHRLPVVPSGRLAEQPCPALVTRGEGRTCRIYDDRPRACHRFTCQLYARHQREGGDLEARLAIVRRVRELIARLDAMGLGYDDFADLPALEARGPDGVRAVAAHDELSRMLEADFARA